jgi:hypothetical protein
MLANPFPSSDDELTVPSPVSSASAPGRPDQNEAVEGKDAIGSNPEAIPQHPGDAERTLRGVIAPAAGAGASSAGSADHEPEGVPPTQSPDTVGSARISEFLQHPTVCIRPRLHSVMLYTMGQG